MLAGRGYKRNDRRLFTRKIRLGEQVVRRLAIDSTWVATHLELGRLGVAIVVAFLLVLLLAAVTRPAGPRRAIALFLTVYCLMASFTETGLGDASPNLLTGQ